MSEIEKLKLMTKLDQIEKELCKLADQLPNELYWKASDIYDELIHLEFKINELNEEEYDYDSAMEEKSRELEVWK